MWSVPGVVAIRESIGSSSFPTWTATTGYLFYFPIYFIGSATVQAVRMIVTTAVASSNARIGLYTADKEYKPVARVSDFGTITTDTTGYKEITGLSAAVSAGPHLLAFMCDTTGVAYRVIRGFPFTGWSRPPVAGRNDNWAIDLYLTYTYGTMPTSMQNPTTYTDNSGIAPAYPIDMKWTT